MKIAVTGAGTPAGARLIEAFHLGEGPTLTAVERHTADLTAAARFAIDLKVADFFDVASLARSFSGCSAVVHLGGYAIADLKRGIGVLCRAAAQAGVRRVVFLSSADVHGRCPPIGTNERSPLHTRHEDADTNALVLAEKQFFAECRQLNVAGCALRAGVLHGPRTELMARLAVALQEGRATLLRGEGIFNGLYLDNLVGAIRVALKSKAAAGGAFLVTDGPRTTWREFYHTVASHLNISSTRIQTLDNATDLTASADADLLERQRCTWQLPTTRAAAELGYQPAVSLPDAVRRSCAWWRFAHGEFFAAA